VEILRECEIVGRTIETYPTIPSNAGSKTYGRCTLTAVESDDEGTKFRCLPISNSGDLIGGWPEGFFDERMDEVL